MGFNLGGFMDSLFGGASKPERQLSGLGQASYGSPDIQKYLPPELRYKAIQPILASGMAGIGNLIQHPGALGPGVAEAIAPRLAAESESIATNFRGLQQENAGSAARSNAPVSLKAAIDAALGIGQERAQRGARREALSESENLRRADTEQMYQLLGTILNFIQSGKGQSIQALGLPAQIGQQRQAAQMQFIGDLIGSFTGMGAV